MKINIILPYKETYSEKLAGAVSLLVSEVKNQCKFKNNIRIFGSLILKKPLTKDYISCDLSDKPFYYIFGRTSYYLENIKKKISKKKSIIEVHNRPQAANFFINNNNNNNKIILYFHNDPLTLRGSKYVYQRMYLLKNLDKLIFVSEWTKRQFFKDLPILDSEKCLVIYPGSNLIKKVIKKKNNIVFAGKLNQSKGYNIFTNVISEILNKNRSWTCDIVGDDPRYYEKIKNPKIHYHGWLPYKKTMEIFEKSKIAVIPSTWDEPLGRTAIEAASRGCVSIISKRGGLIETNRHGLFLNYVTKEELYNKLNKIINSPSLINFYSKKTFKEFKHSINKTINQINTIYKELK
ncbi:MAG: glycosyltransferase family 4 protein [Candidatus Fonsibacter sp.]|nr:glycosyltransferase family 4 protein [Candidatus Fonsibacter sp.]